MTKKEVAIVMAYTGDTMLTGDDLKYFYDYVSELLGRTAYTHDFFLEDEKIKLKAEPDFIKLCETLKDYDGVVGV